MCSFTKISDSWWCVQRGAVIRNVLWSCLFTRVTQFRNQRETGRVAETETGFTLLHVSAPWKWIWSCYFRVKQLHNLALNPFPSYLWARRSGLLSSFIHSNSIFSLPHTLTLEMWAATTEGQKYVTEISFNLNIIQSGYPHICQSSESSLRSCVM